MEYSYLSHITGSNEYRETIMKPIRHVNGLSKHYEGLYPIYINPYSGKFTNDKITFGAMGDSFYEYLMKMWLLTGKTNDLFKTMYQESMRGMITHLLSQDSEGLWYIADLENGRKVQKMDHLVCFAPGMLALGAMHGIVDETTGEQHMKIAKDLMKTCYESYARQSSGIGPEYMTFYSTMGVGDSSYKLRPEMVESLFVLYRMTGDKMYREWGWNTFQAIEKHCKVDGGYVSLKDVRSPQFKEDKMESFFLAETLKYLYLLFSDNKLIPLDEGSGNGKMYVFNTECHPLTAWKE
jgi:mannosyl-oligosaccharide alpha-1,2-mannosidase